MHYASIKACDIANGVGVRTTLFVSGCRHHCKECFNSEAWSFQYGELYTEKQEQQILDYLAPDYITGLSLLGGEPFEKENQPTVLELVKKVKELYPNKTIWCYSGFRFDDELYPMSQNWNVTKELLEHLDVLVDGRFEIENKKLGLKFRGSTNQRILDVPQSLAAKKGILKEGME